MPNRYQSIIDNLSENALEELRELYPKLATDVTWAIAKGQLCAMDKNGVLEFSFEKGDPDSEAFLILLNNMKYLVQSLGAKQ